MSKIVLLSCVSKKKPVKDRAKDLYLSPLFRLSLKYAYSLKPKSIFILSAKHGLLPLDQEIHPYDLTLNRMSPHDRRKWTAKTITQLSKHCDLSGDHFILLAGLRYRQYLLPELSSFEVPMKGLTIGKQLQFLKNQCIDG